MVGLAEAAVILGTAKQNLIRSNGQRLNGLPPPLQERGIDGFDVIATPLWPRSEITELRELRRGENGSHARPSRRRARRKTPAPA
jgi:hypothetical protein